MNVLLLSVLQVSKGPEDDNLNALAQSLWTACEVGSAAVRARSLDEAAYRQPFETDDDIYKF